MAIQKFGDSRTIVLYQLTATPDRTAAIKEGADSEMYAGTIATLQDGMDILRSMVEGEADVVTTCNTAHHFLAQIDYPEGIRPASLIRSTCESLIEDMRDGDVQVFALYTSGTRGAEVYSAEMSQNQISFVEPDMDTQDELMNAIYKGVKAFDSDIAFEEGEKVFRKIPEGTTHILAGCTEIPEVIDLVIERTTDSDLRDKLRGLRVVDPTSEAFDSVLRISSVQDDARSKIGINGYEINRYTCPFGFSSV
ncbi:MAG: aspartate/glutamate racemase family protein, partial [Candidatus Gracilibacteria bacterium]|nr:aspartate/glutamate racemase family protein [Candidatus Gracilibacteria bacterium]